MAWYRPLAQLSAEVGLVPCEDLKGGAFAHPNSGGAIEALAHGWYPLSTLLQLGSP
jgi:hypothetical protein